MKTGTPRDDREEILAWARLNPTATPQDLADRWQVPKTTAVRYHRKAKQREPKPPKAPPTPPASPKRGAPAKAMEPSDREEVLATVRDTYAILRNLAARIRRVLERQIDEDGELPKLDRDTSQAMLNLQRMAAGLIDAHPGLLELVKASGDEEVSEDDLRSILQALGVT